MSDEYLDIPVHLLRGRDPIRVVRVVRLADRLAAAVVARWRAVKGAAR